MGGPDEMTDRWQPGTLLWIGPKSHPEVRPAFEYCYRQAAQLAVRRDAAEAVRRPAGFVRRIVFARPGRQIPRAITIERLAATYPNAESIAICGQLCDGEGRTGDAWPLGERLRFSRWADRLPEWLGPCVRGAEIAGQSMGGELAPNLLIIADRFETAEPLMLWADSVGVCSAWHRRFVAAIHCRFDTVLWDDSAAPPSSPAGWRDRLTGGQGQRSGRYGGGPTRHVWMALQPSIDEVCDAHEGGIGAVLTKPVVIDAIPAAIRCKTSPIRVRPQQWSNRPA